MNQRCDNCEFWKRIASNGMQTLGDCRRRAPQLVALGDAIASQQFPRMLSHDVGCGEFRRKPKQESEA